MKKYKEYKMRTRRELAVEKWAQGVVFGFVLGFAAGWILFKLI